MILMPMLCFLIIMKFPYLIMTIGVAVGPFAVSPDDKIHPRKTTHKLHALLTKLHIFIPPRLTFTVNAISNPPEVKSLTLTPFKVGG